MQNQEGLQVQVDGEVESGPAPSVATPEFDEWASFGDQDIMQQESEIRAEEAEKIPFLGDKARLNSRSTFMTISSFLHLFACHNRSIAFNEVLIFCCDK